MKYRNNSKLAISVVICTYNRAELLANSLQTLCEQTINKSDYEVLVVDNNSRDSTPNLTESFCRSYPNIRYVLETKQGLSHARNRGWQEAKGRYVAYVDDDCKMPNQWLTIAMQIIDRIAPAVFGGPAYAFYNSPKPYWWKDHYGTYEQSQVSRPLRRLEYLKGNNIFFCREVLEGMNGFDARLGMSDKKLGYHEETELQIRIRKTMPDELIYYDPNLHVFHLVRPETMTLPWILNSSFASGRYSYYAFQSINPIIVRLTKFQLLIKACVTLFLFFTDILVGLLRYDRERYPHLQNYLYENTIRYMIVFGEIYEQYMHS
jgi:glycosyltransferase involved in cell wall biosynthesis